MELINTMIYNERLSNGNRRFEFMDTDNNVGNILFLRSGRYLVNQDNVMQITIKGNIVAETDNGIISNIHDLAIKNGIIIKYTN